MPSNLTLTGQSKSGLVFVFSNSTSPDTSNVLPGAILAPSATAVPCSMTSWIVSSGMYISPDERHLSVGNGCWSVFPARSCTINFGSRLVSPKSGIVHSKWNCTLRVMSSSYGPAGPFCPIISQSSITK